MESKNLNFNKGAEDLGKLKMSAEEKKKMLGSIFAASPFDRRIIPDRRSVPSFYFSKRSLKYYALVFSVLVVFISGSLRASAKSLPGDFLYPLKVGIVEPLHSALILSPIAKAEYQSSLAVKRLVEAESLQKQDKLDAPKEKELNALLESHTSAFNQEVENMRNSRSAKQNTSAEEKADNENGEEDDAVINFRANMNAHAKVLELIGGENLGGAEDESGQVKISETAKVNAEKVIKSSPKDKRNQESYQKRKDYIRSLIESASSDLNSKVRNDSAIKKSVLDNTKKTIDQASELLKEAEKADQEGDQNSAYSKLFDSEASAREAKIFLNAGLRLEDRNVDSSRENR